MALAPAPAASSPATRRVMQGNRRAHTKPEIAVRRALHAAGLRFRVDLRIRTSSGASARPDVAFTRWRVAIFVDGCYWHGCPHHGTQPRTNAAWWQAKIAHNQRRDIANTTALQADGWIVIRVWEHETPQHALRSPLGTRRIKPNTAWWRRSSSSATSSTCPGRTAA